MKRILWSALLALATLGVGHAQVDISKLITGSKVSPEAITAARYGRPAKTVWIFYHAPSVKGRKIFNGAGALQPDDSIWRLGADYATVLHTDADLDINGLAVPKGDYTLYIALNKGKWELIVNKQLMDANGARPIWGVTNANATTNDPAKEVGRTALTMGKPAAPVETLKITLSEAAGKGNLEIAWENVTASVAFTPKVETAPPPAKK